MVPHPVRVSSRIVHWMISPRVLTIQIAITNKIKNVHAIKIKCVETKSNHRKKSIRLHDLVLDIVRIKSGPICVPSNQL